MSIEKMLKNLEIAPRPSPSRLRSGKVREKRINDNNKPQNVSIDDDTYITVTSVSVQTDENLDEPSIINSNREESQDEIEQLESEDEDDDDDEEQYYAVSEITEAEPEQEVDQLVDDVPKLTIINSKFGKPKLVHEGRF